MLGYLADRLRGSHTAMVWTAATNSGVGSPVVVNAKTGAVAPLASFFDVEGFLDDVRRILAQNIEGFDLIAAVHTAIDSRFDSAAAPPNFTRADLYHLHEHSLAGENSSIEAWTERAYESGEGRHFIVLAVWFSG